MGTAPRPQQIEVAPDRIWLHQLCDLLAWYETNLCSKTLVDPRGCRVSFSIERFAHSIKLLNKSSRREVDNPKKQAQAIKEGRKTNADFGGYSTERAQTLTWIEPTILRPSRILELTAQPLIGPQKPGDTLYVKEFSNTQRRYRFKVLVCRRVGTVLLVPITCHPRDHGRYPNHYKQVYP